MPQQGQSIYSIDPDKFILLSGRSNPKLARSIARLLSKELFEPITLFSDGEIRVQVPENLRRRHVFIIQPTCTPVNDSIMELILMVDAVKRAAADEITVITPYFGYSRQDRKELPRVPISSSIVANIIEHIGVDRIVTIDIHSAQQQGFVRIPWENLYGSYTLIPELKKRKLQNLTIASPDKGGVARATGYARLLKASSVVIVYKERDVNVNDKSQAFAMIGDVKGKDVLMVDDMISTAGTISHAANFLKKKGAKRVVAAATHGLFSGDALEKINNSAIDEIIVTDTVPATPEIKKNKKITMVTVAPLLAEAIKRIESGESISKDLIL